MGDAVVTLTEELYHALKLCPCSCTMRWCKDGAEMEVVKQCPKCKAIDRYEMEFSPMRSPDFIQ